MKIETMNELEIALASLERGAAGRVRCLVRSQVKQRVRKWRAAVVVPAEHYSKTKTYQAVEGSVGEAVTVAVQRAFDKEAP